MKLKNIMIFSTVVGVILGLQTFDTLWLTYGLNFILAVLISLFVFRTVTIVVGAILVFIVNEWDKRNIKHLTTTDISKEDVLRRTKKQELIHSSFSVGIYTLNMKLNNFARFTELSPTEYVEVKPQFKGEKIYHAPPIIFLGYEWQTTIGVIYNQVYKIAITIQSDPLYKNEINEIVSATLNFCNAKLGKPTELKPGFYWWDTTDGNVILRFTETPSILNVGLFLTSSGVRNFSKARGMKIKKPSWLDKHIIVE